MVSSEYEIVRDLSTGVRKSSAEVKNNAVLTSFIRFFRE
jgi:hypothetical protein